MNVLAIDPGKHECACALFRGGTLALAWFAAVNDRIPGVDACLVEVPQFDGRVSKDVIPLATNGALLAGRTLATTVRFLEPREWKGSTPKPVHHMRLWRGLSSGERATLPTGTFKRIVTAVERGAKDAWRKPGGVYYGRAKGAEVHNLLDAVGLGLYHLERHGSKT